MLCQILERIARMPTIIEQPVAREDKRPGANGSNGRLGRDERLDERVQFLARIVARLPEISPRNQQKLDVLRAHSGEIRIRQHS